MTNDRLVLRQRVTTCVNFRPLVLGPSIGDVEERSGGAGVSRQEFIVIRVES